MLETGVDPGSDSDDALGFLEAGDAARGDYHCADCGYGVSVQVRLPACPMCGGRIWERAGWSAGARLL